MERGISRVSRACGDWIDEPAPYRARTHRTAGLVVVGKPGVGACSERGDERLDERDGVVHQLS
jgi:hypothetical protein